MSLLESAPHEIAQFIVQRTQPTEQDDDDDDDDDAVIVLQDKSSLLSSNWIAFFVEDVWQREKQQLFNTQPLQRGKHLLVQPVKCTRTQGP